MRLIGVIAVLVLGAASAAAQPAPVTSDFATAWAQIEKARASAEDFLLSTEDLMTDGNVTSACSMANQARIRFEEIAAGLKTLPARPSNAAMSAAELAKAKGELAKRHTHVKEVFKEACA